MMCSVVKLLSPEVFGGALVAKRSCVGRRSWPVAAVTGGDHTATQSGPAALVVDEVVFVIVDLREKDVMCSPRPLPTKKISSYFYRDSRCKPERSSKRVRFIMGIHIPVRRCRSSE